MKRALLITWACAAAIALLNLQGLWPLIVTPLAPIEFARWLPFLAVPLAVAVGAALLALALRRNFLVVNLAFWLAFFAAAEAWRVYKMADVNVLKGATCSEQHSFLRSLTIARQPLQFELHAAAVVEGRVMLWSYAEQAYFEIGPNTYQNLDFTTCRDSVQALLEKAK